MATGDNVRYVTISRFADGVVAANFVLKKGPRSAACAETMKKVLSSGNIKPNSQLTVTVNEEVGTLHLVSGEGDVLAVMTASSYPRRQAFKLLSEIREHVAQDITPDVMQGVKKEGDLNKLAGGWLKELCGKYDDLARVDKMTAMGIQVEEVKTIMEGNINRVLENTENLSEVENKSDMLVGSAQQFQKRSETVRKVLWWRNFKVKLIFFLLISAVLGYILTPIIIDQINKGGGGEGGGGGGVPRTHGPRARTHARAHTLHASPDARTHARADDIRGPMIAVGPGLGGSQVGGWGGGEKPWVVGCFSRETVSIPTVYTN